MMSNFKMDKKTLKLNTSKLNNSAQKIEKQNKSLT